MDIVKTNDKKYGYDIKSGSVINIDENDWKSFEATRKKASQFENMQKQIIELTKRVIELEKKTNG